MNQIGEEAYKPDSVSAAHATEDGHSSKQPTLPVSACEADPDGPPGGAEAPNRVYSVLLRGEIAAFHPPAFAGDSSLWL